MLELKSTVFKIKYNDEVYDMRHPNIIEIRNYEKTLKKGDELECVLTFLETLGLPKKVSSMMEVGHLKKIQENFLPKK